MGIVCPKSSRTDSGCSADGVISGSQCCIMEDAVSPIPVASVIPSITMKNR